MTGERVDVEAVRADLAKYIEAFNRTGLPNEAWCSLVAGSAIDVTEHVDPLLAALGVAEQRADEGEAKIAAVEKLHRPIKLGKQGCGTKGTVLVECAVCLGERWPCRTAAALSDPDTQGGQ